MTKFMVLAIVAMLALNAGASHLNVYNYEPLGSAVYSTSLYGTPTYYPAQYYKQSFYNTSEPLFGRLKYDLVNGIINDYYGIAGPRTTYYSKANYPYGSNFTYGSGHGVYYPNYYSGIAMNNVGYDRVATINYGNIIPGGYGIYGNVAYQAPAPAVYTAPSQSFPLPRFDEYTDYSFVPDNTGEKLVRVKLSDSGFSPQNITVEKNQRVRLTVENSSSRPRVFWMEGIDLGSRIIGSNDSADIVFTAPNQIRDLKFYDSVPGEKGVSGIVWVRQKIEATQPNMDKKNAISTSTLFDQYNSNTGQWEVAASAGYHQW